MKKAPIHMHFEEGVEDGAPVRRLILEGVDSPLGPRCDIWWRFPGQTTLPPIDVLDSLAGGFVLWASALGQDMVVHGPMTRSGLRNLDRLIETRRSLWAQQPYKTIEIQPDEISDIDFSTYPRGRTLAGFSGGVDSTFTVMRHAKKLPGPRSYPLDGLVLVHGFDIRLHHKDQFEILRKRSERFAASLSLPLYTVVSNGHHFAASTWPQSAMPMFGTVLSQCVGSRGTGIVSSGAPYGSAYGSFSHTPPLDALSSHDAFELVTDGAGFNRGDKLELLLRYPECLSDLRVCWEGDDPSRNCGVCEKCVVTRLDFLALGIENPPCFDTPLMKEHIARFPLRSVTDSRDFFRFSLESLLARNVHGPIADYFRKRMSRVPPDHIAPVLWRWIKYLRLAAARFRTDW